VEEQLGKIKKDLLSKQEVGEIWKLNLKGVYSGSICTVSKRR
jgi:hypothetical protein